MIKLCTNLYNYAMINNRMKINILNYIISEKEGARV